MTREPDAWSAPYRVRFDEAAPDGRLRTSALLRYAQDVAWSHSTSRGYDRAWYAERGLTWLVRAASVGIVAPIHVYAELVGTTRVVGWRRVWARRGTEFHDPNGELVAWVQIDWVLLDTRGAPTRIPAEFEPAFGTATAKLGLARVALGDPPPEARRSAIAVRPQELDPMAHVNNAIYADWLEEAVIGAGDPLAPRTVPRVARLEYAAPADLETRLTADTWPTADGWSFLLQDETGLDLVRARLEPGEATSSAT
jgi:acyl-CoA thioesterase FadM